MLISLYLNVFLFLSFYFFVRFGLRMHEKVTCQMKISIKKLMRLWCIIGAALAQYSLSVFVSARERINCYGYICMTTLCVCVLRVYENGEHGR